MRISHAKTSDVSMLDQIVFQAGASHVLDRGYIDFARFWRIHQARASLVTRAKSKMDYRMIERRAVEPGGAVTHDPLIRPRGPKSRRLYPETLRRVRHVDPETGRRLTFLTNHLTLDATSIALVYRKRWTVELYHSYCLHCNRLSHLVGQGLGVVSSAGVHDTLGGLGIGRSGRPGPPPALVL